MFYKKRLQIVNCYIVKSHFSTFKNNLLMMDRCISWKEALARRRAVRSSRVAEHNSVTNDANPHLVGASFEADNGRHFDTSSATVSSVKPSTSRSATASTDSLGSLNYPTTQVQATTLSSSRKRSVC